MFNLPWQVLFHSITQPPFGVVSIHASFNDFFIRPDSGTKVFTGLVINQENFDHEINSLKALTGVMEDTIIIVSNVCKIEKEYRAIIAGKKIISASQYVNNGKVEELFCELPIEAIKILEKVVNSQIELELYTCDLSYSKEDGFKLLEINSFNCAGLYECDYIKVVEKVSSFVLEKYSNDELDLNGDGEINKKSIIKY